MGKDEARFLDEHAHTYHQTSEHKTRAELGTTTTTTTQGTQPQGNTAQIGGFLSTGVSFVGNLGYCGEITDLEGLTPYSSPSDFLVQLYSEHYPTTPDSH